MEDITPSPDHVPTARPGNSLESTRLHLYPIGQAPIMIPPQISPDSLSKPLYDRGLPEDPVPESSEEESPPILSNEGPNASVGRDVALNAAASYRHEESGQIADGGNNEAGVSGHTSAVGDNPQTPKTALERWVAHGEIATRPSGEAPTIRDASEYEIGASLLRSAAVAGGVAAEGRAGMTARFAVKASNGTYEVKQKTLGIKEVSMHGYSGTHDRVAGEATSLAVSAAYDSEGAAFKACNVRRAAQEYVSEGEGPYHIPVEALAARIAERYSEQPLPDPQELELIDKNYGTSDWLTMPARSVETIAAKLTKMVSERLLAPPDGVNLTADIDVRILPSNNPDMPAVMGHQHVIFSAEQEGGGSERTFYFTCDPATLEGDEGLYRVGCGIYEEASDTTQLIEFEQSGGSLRVRYTEGEDFATRPNTKAVVEVPVSSDAILNLARLVSESLPLPDVQTTNEAQSDEHRLHASAARGESDAIESVRPAAPGDSGDVPPDEPPPPGVPAESGGDDFDRERFRQQIDEYTHKHAVELADRLAFSYPAFAELAQRHAREYVATLSESMRSGDEAVPDDARDALIAASTELIYAFTDVIDYERFKDLVSEVRTTLEEQGAPSDIHATAKHVHTLAARMFLVKQSLADAQAIPSDMSPEDLFTHVREYLANSPQYPDEDETETEIETEVEIEQVANPGPPRSEHSSDYVPFEPYRQLMSDIQAQIAQVNPEEIEGSVAPGGMHYEFETPDGKTLKLSRQQLNLEEFRSEYVVPYIFGRGIQGLEQMLTYTETNGGAVVCEKPPGRTMDQLSQEELDAIPREHFGAFMRLSEEISRYGIDPDLVERNVTYDPQAGFTLMNYGIVPRVPLMPNEAAELAWSSVLTQGVYDRHGEMQQAAVKFLEAYQAAFGQDRARALEQEWSRHRPPRAAD